MASNVQGMKVLLLDKETTGIVSMVYTQSQILQKEVFLFEKLDAPNREVMGHLKAVCFLRPTVENIHLLITELREPKYGEYHLFFTNTLKNVSLEDLAQADEHEVVKEVQEYFADYYAINTDLFTLNIEGALSQAAPEWPSSMERITDGIASVLLSLKKKPSVRYQKKSDLTYRIAQEIARRMNQEAELFHFSSPATPPLLLILDRRDDPVTPLLMQWTYQAMVHELLGIHNHRVDLRHVQGINQDLKEVVLSTEHDSFFRQNCNLNFGDLGVKIKELVDEYQDKSKKNENIKSIDDMKRFVENYPEFRKMAGNVSKHVAIMSELSRKMDERCLMDLSEVEQELACNHSPAEAFSKVSALIDDPRIQKFDKLKLVLLYSIRYEEAGRVSDLVEALLRNGLERDEVALVSAMSEYAGASVRVGDLLGNKNIINRARTTLKRGLQGVTNIYAQHKPLLTEILDQVARNKLKDTIYPYLVGSVGKDRPQDVIVFIVGGCTYEESCAIQDFLAKPENQGMRIILGGTTLHNSHSFLKEVGKLRSVSLR
jgi:vacuolar protein sorting-associated protein 45